MTFSAPPDKIDPVSDITSDPRRRFGFVSRSPLKRLAASFERCEGKVIGALNLKFKKWYRRDPKNQFRIYSHEKRISAILFPNVKYKC